MTGLIRDDEGQKMSKSKGNVIDPLDMVDGISLPELLEKRTGNMMQPQLADKIRKRTEKQFPNGIEPHARLGTGCVPFLMPLMLQVGFGYQAFIAGCMMAPTALGSIIAKSMVTQVLRRLGYRHTLVGITVIIGHRC